MTTASQHKADLAEVAPKIAAAIRSVLADQRKSVQKTAERAMHRSYQEWRSGNEGNAAPLIDWYNSGADGAISWGDEGDWQQCVDVASGYMAEEDAKGFCELRHQDATGMTTAEHCKQDKG